MPDLPQTRIGTVLTLRGAVSAELFAEPFDFVWIDLEHAALSSADAQDMILGAQAAGTAALVRLRCDAFSSMTHVLDAGADGIVLADVPDADTVREVVTRITHPPHGVRGWGPRRSGLRGRTRGRAPATPLLWTQIESPAGVEAVERIAAVPGVDTVVVGTADLSLALGVPQRFDAPELLAAVDRVRSAAIAHGTEFGVAGPLTTAPHDLVRAASILCHSTDARMAASGADSAAATLRQHAKENS
ncbi:HpcH/HpaI aldolase family protein [Microbacterium sp. 179-I 3D3 NHS]|uniref:HpcH/HpaI aldolase family protein n=1 Tax=unclassified Microbacterium TaxID=2609290 RepID=UPI00399F14D7